MIGDRPPEIWDKMLEHEAQMLLSEGVDPAQAAEIMIRVRGILGESNESIYYQLVSLVIVMNLIGCDQTGMLLEQTRFTFFDEGQKNRG